MMDMDSPSARCISSVRALTSSLRGSPLTPGKCCIMASSLAANSDAGSFTSMSAPNCMEPERSMTPATIQGLSAKYLLICMSSPPSGSGTLTTVVQSSVSASFCWPYMRVARSAALSLAGTLAPRLFQRFCSSVCCAVDRFLRKMMSVTTSVPAFPLKADPGRRIAPIRSARSAM